jgi:hypothetical protein
VALIGGDTFLDPGLSHNLTGSYKPGLEALISDESRLGGQPEYLISTPKFSKLMFMS